MLVFSAADFEDFTEPRPELNPNLETELTEVIELLAANKWPFRLHAAYSEDFFSIPEERIKHLESVLTIVDGKPVYASAEFSDLSPPPLAVSPDWSPVKHFGGYHNESKISFAAVPSRKTSNTQNQQNLHLSSLSMPGSLSQYWGGLACACCF